METIFILIATLCFIFLGGIVQYTGSHSILVKFFFVLMALYGLILSLIRFGFLVKPSWIG